jgi:benzoylformate decarboxylase
MANRTGGELIQDFLGTYEIPYVFGNPGTTETTFLAAVAASKATYILALHESSAVGIATGYALITGKPSIVSLHTYPGLANGMFNMRNALMAGVTRRRRWQRLSPTACGTAVHRPLVDTPGR